MANKVGGISTKQVAAALAAASNSTIWDLLRQANPTFKSWTAGGTAQKFTEQGFEAIKSNPEKINDFTKTMLMVVFQRLNAVSARNAFRDSGLIEVYDTPNGGYVQRMSIGALKPVTPAYNDLATGNTVDPFVQRIPETSERFFPMNFDYQNVYTIPWTKLKTAFISENGIGEWMAGVAQAADAAYTVQDYENIKSVLNSILNSTEWPLQSSQNLGIAITDVNAMTENEAQGLLMMFQNIAESMEAASMTGMYSNMNFPRVTRPEDYVLLLRTGIRSQLNVKTYMGAFNPERGGIPFEIIPVNDFGGIEHYKEETLTTQVYPAYDTALGIENGWSDTEGGTADASITTTYTKDPNASVIGMIVERGKIFENAQNPYTVSPIPNPRGMYDNYWINRPGNGIVSDPLYNCIVIQNTTGNA